MKSSETLEIKRGDILWINCDPSVGSEPRKVRTCVVVSNDLANQFGSTVTVVPTLSYNSIRASQPFMVDLRRPRSNMTEPRVANASLVSTYDRGRVASRAGRVAPQALEALARALSIHLGLREL